MRNTPAGASRRAFLFQIGAAVLASLLLVHGSAAEDDGGASQTGAAALGVEVSYKESDTKETPDGSAKIVAVDPKGHAIAGVTVKYVTGHELAEKTADLNSYTSAPGAWQRDVTRLYHLPENGGATPSETPATRPATSDGPGHVPALGKTASFSPASLETNRQGTVRVPAAVARGKDGSAWVWLYPPGDLAQVIVRVPGNVGSVRVTLPAATPVEGDAIPLKAKSPADQYTVIARRSGGLDINDGDKYTFPLEYECPLSSENTYRLRGVCPGDYRLMMRIVHADPPAVKVSEVHLDDITVDPPARAEKREGGEHDIPNVLHP